MVVSLSLVLTIAGAKWQRGRLVVYPDGSEIDESLKLMLLATKNLETLRLNFDPTEDYALRFLKWFGSPAFNSSAVTSSPFSISLPHLTSLDLGMLDVDKSTLLNVVAKYDLISLSLWKITLRCPDEESFDAEPNLWACFFSELSAALPVSASLRRLLVGFIYQQYFDRKIPKGKIPQGAARILFKPDAHSTTQSPDELVQQITHRAAYGASAKDWLKEISARTSYEIRDSSHEDSDSEANSEQVDEGPDEDDEGDETYGEGQGNSDDDLI